MSAVYDPANNTLDGIPLIDWQYGMATQYVSAVGLVCLFYDHLLTVEDEVALVWRARPSFQKFLFLINRYGVLFIQITAAFFLNHWEGADFGNNLTEAHVYSCWGVILGSGVLAVCSISIANILVLMRVVVLWDLDKRVKLYMSLGFAVSACTTAGLMLAAMITLKPDISYVAPLHLCALSTHSGLFSAALGAPMLFELIVFISTCLNALDRPRDSHMSLITILYRDGIFFFLALTSLRAFNLFMSIFAPADLVLLGSYFVWALTTVVLNRSLLHIQRLQLLYPIDNDTSTLSGIRLVPLHGAPPFALEDNSNSLLKDPMRDGYQLAQTTSNSSKFQITMPMTMPVGPGSGRERRGSRFSA